ncbi:MAG TPA: HdeD family acid-resistance protein [Steroidobacteraceae bacterium]|nr:HdeD family acid-resistance protein [Steroidobacteraceae bacterium]
MGAAVKNDVDIAPTFSRGWTWLLALGAVQLVAGVVAIAAPMVATFAATAVFGLMLIIAAVFHVVHAFTVRRWGGFALHLLVGILQAGVGAIALLNPLAGAMALTLMIATLFFAEGVLQIVLAFASRPRDGWGWFFLSGLASVVLATLLAFGWPAIALWAIGTLLGIRFIIAGGTSLALAFACRTREQNHRGDHPGEFAAVH